jgi:UDP-N-acetylmuramyl tripeptide synthase
MSADEPHDPLAVLRAPPTSHQVVEFIYEEIEHAISMASSADELAVVAQLLEKAQAIAEQILAGHGGAPLVPRSPSN